MRSVYKGLRSRIGEGIHSIRFSIQDILRIYQKRFVSLIYPSREIGGWLFVKSLLSGQCYYHCGSRNFGLWTNGSCDFRKGAPSKASIRQCLRAHLFFWKKYREFRRYRTTQRSRVGVVAFMHSVEGQIYYAATWIEVTIGTSFLPEFMGPVKRFRSITMSYVS